MLINANEIKVKNNWVLIKPDGNHETYHSAESGKDTGLHVAPWGINQASHIAVTGTVVSAPQALTYLGVEIKRRRRDVMRSDNEQKELARLRESSVAYDVNMELIPGYKVYFEYTTRVSAVKEGRSFETEQGQMLLLPYDQLIMIFKPETNFNDVKISDVYMLNGMVLIKPLEYASEKGSDGIKGVKTESGLFMNVDEDSKFIRRGKLGYANVLASGCLVKSYCDFDNTGGDDKNVGYVGQKVAYYHQQQKRLEVKHHRVIFKGHELYRIHRKDIACIFPDGKIV